jgi:2-phosphosulfolactate phosphatase
MKVLRKSLARGAREARGLVVIIDVFRAFSCEPLFFHFGVRKVILEADPAKAIHLKKQHPEFILVGEVDEVPLEGADMGNSPSKIVLKGEAYFKKKIVVHRTTAGVTGVSAALGEADEVLLGSFLMGKAIAGYVRRKRPGLVTLVAMGDRAKTRAPEDEICADYLEHLLTGRPYDPIGALKEMIFQPTAQKFILMEKEYLPREDPIFCLQKDLFDFVLGVKRESDYMVVFRAS